MVEQHNDLDAHGVKELELSQIGRAVSSLHHADVNEVFVEVDPARLLEHRSVVDALDSQHA